MKHRIPYAVGNFEQLIDDEYYFVDKTHYLHQLEQYRTPVFLRPRRFGKSLWCSLLECYYDINRRERFEALFGKLAIEHDPTPERNSYLVMRFNFSKVEVESKVEGLRTNFNHECARSFSDFTTRYAHLLGKTHFNRDDPAADVLADLCAEIRNGKLPPIYLIIDEYDNFTNQLVTNHQDALYREITAGNSFLRAFFKVIKAGMEDRSIGRAFITGVLPITIDDLTSGFNIAEIITLAPNTLSMLGDAGQTGFPLCEHEISARIQIYAHERRTQKPSAAAQRPPPRRRRASHALCGRHSPRVPAVHHPPLHRLHCRAERV